MGELTISRAALRRFVLGRQGLWPGRRFSGQTGVRDVVRTMEAVQVDPLQVVAHSHDIALFGRVEGYRPSQLECLLYRERTLFEYGGGLFIYPIEELPYWQVPMRRRRAEKRWGGFADDHRELMDSVRAALRERGPLGPRDLEEGLRVANYRGGRESSLALYALWLFGETMVHHREGSQRVYDLAERLAPPELLRSAADPEAELHFARRTVAQHGVVRARALVRWLASLVGRRFDREEGLRFAQELLAAGEIAAVNLEDERGGHYVLSEDVPLLEEVIEGRVPAAWRPLATDTTEEAVFLAPLDIVSARGRAKELFDFEYVWEVYKPATKRQYGYYVLPILYGDRLVGRLDPKLSRKSRTLEILGFWLEADAPAEDPNFAQAVGRGLAHFADFLGAERVLLGAIGDGGLSARVSEAIDRHIGESAAGGASSPADPGNACPWPQVGRSQPRVRQHQGQGGNRHLDPKL